jgi:hypothetical protein
VRRNKAPRDRQRMSEPDAWDPGSPPKPRADAGVSTPGTSSDHGIGPNRPVRHAGGSRRIRLYNRSTTTSTVPQNRIHHPCIITRFAAVVTTLAGAVLAPAAAAPAAFAILPPEQGGTGDRFGRDPHRDRRRHARREDHSDRTCDRGPRRGRGSAAGPCRRDAAAHAGAKRLKHAAAALRCGCRSRPDLPVGSCRRGCRPQRQSRRPAREGFINITGNPGEDARMVDLSTADDLAVR